MTKKKTPPAVITVTISDLIEDPNNPNKMTAGEFDQLVSNIEAHGFLAPILVSLRDGETHIVDGHHRARAAAKAGLKSILAVVWDGTEEMRKALAIGMNKIRGELDLSEVAKIIAELHDDGWSTKDLTITGYSEDELTDLLKISEQVTSEDVLQGTSGMGPDDEDSDTPAIDRPLVLELNFSTSAELKLAKRGLSRAAGKGRELGEGLLKLLSGDGE
jgi:ParB/RepB/Spo0J family partition protein